MADWVKMAAKVAIIAAVTAAIVALFTGVVIPELDLTTFITAIGKGKAIVNYYAGWLVPILNLGLFFLGLKYIVFPAFWLLAIGFKWVLKVNE